MDFAPRALIAELDSSFRFCCHTSQYGLLIPRKSLFSSGALEMLTIKLTLKAGRNFYHQGGLKLVQQAVPSLCAI